MKKQTTTAFAHTKGGVGKSTLCWHTAMMLQARGESVTVIDLDFQQTIYFLGQIRSKNVGQDITVLKPKSVRGLLGILHKHRSDHVLIDIGGFDNDINRAAIKAADRLIVPISNSVTEVLGFKTFEKILEKIGAGNVHVLLSNIHPLASNFEEIASAVDVHNVELLPATVRSRKVYREGMGTGRSVFDLQSAAAKKAQREIEEVWHGLECDQ